MMDLAIGTRSTIVSRSRVLLEYGRREKSTS
jgi:hypothetical protein